MSFDRQLEQICPHLVVDEFLFPTGRTTILPMRPIASSSSVVVRVNSLVEIPSFGLTTSASSSGTRLGPFTIKAGVNDTLRVKVNSGDWQTAIISPGVQIPVNRLGDRLTAALNGVQFSDDGNGHLAFSASDSGSGSTIYISSDSTLATLVGLPTNREFRGKQVYPGWTLVRYPGSIPERPVRMIVFDDYLSSDSDFVEVNYTTIRTECRRCGGLGVENDWRYATSGDVYQSINEDLLLQELQKIIFTIKGSNPFHQAWYGTTIIEQIGQKITASGSLQHLIVSDIQTAFTRWQSVKKQQEEVVGQVVTDKEYPFQLQGITLEQSQQDPTIIFVNTTVRNRSNQPITLTRGLKLPLPYDILGSTQQDAIARSIQQIPSSIG